MPRLLEPMSSKKRYLSAAEKALWQHVAKSTRPLFPGQASSLDDRALPDPLVLKRDLEGQVSSRAAQPMESVPSKSKPLPIPGAIDRRTEQRLRRGQIKIDGRIDLHGMTQRRAYSALYHYIHEAQARGLRTILVITGKGGDKRSGSTGYGESELHGVLRRQTPQWLESIEFCRLVSGYSQSHPHHGGQGALYVRLRRQR